MRLTVAGLIIALGMLGACSHVQRLNPWRSAPVVPEIAHELVVETETGAVLTASQTWNRNTVRVALNGMAGEGNFRLRPLPGHGWPIRLEFAIQAGSFSHLELRGAQRVILTLPVAGGIAVLPVPQGIYTADTAELRVHYGS